MRQLLSEIEIKCSCTVNLWNYLLQPVVFVALAESPTATGEVPGERFSTRT